MFFFSFSEAQYCPHLSLTQQTLKKEENTSAGVLPKTSFKQVVTD